MNTTTEPPNEERDDSPARPRRPLSAFNLFYRFKRQKVLQALAPSNTSPVDKDTLCSLVRCAPGLEHYKPKASEEAPSTDKLNDLQRKNILGALSSNMDAKDTKTRQHRKNNAMNGLIGFVELGKLMNDSWKNCDPYAKEVFTELSQGQRDRYRQLMEEYTNAKKGQEKAVKAVPKKKRKSSKKKLPTKKNRALSPPTKDIQEEEDNEYSMAETMLQLTKRAPVSPPKSNNCTTAPSLLDLLSKPEYPSNGGSLIKPVATNSSLQSAPRRTSKLLLPKVMADPISSSSSRLVKPPRPPNNSPNDAKEKPILDQVAAQNRAMAPLPSNQRSFMLPSIQSRPQVNIRSPRATTNVPNRTGDMLMLGLAHRVRELEGQLAAERLRLRIRELESEMSNRRAREGALRSVLDNVAQNRVTAASVAATAAAATAAAGQSRSRPSYLQDGLWSLMSASMIHPSVQSTERAAMLTRIVEPHHALGSKRTLHVSPTESPDLGQSKKPRNN